MEPNIFDYLNKLQRYYFEKIKPNFEIRTFHSPKFTLQYLLLSSVNNKIQSAPFLTIVTLGNKVCCVYIVLLHFAQISTSLAEV